MFIFRETSRAFVSSVFGTKYLGWEGQLQVDLAAPCLQMAWLQCREWSQSCGY